MTRLCIAVILAVLTTIPIRADGLDGTRLYQICEHHNDDAPESIVCSYYIKGLIEGMLFGSITARETVGYCPPKEGLSTEQGRLIIEKYMRDNPRLLNEQASVIAGAAMLLAFPCKKPN